MIKERDSGIDLLRIICIFYVVVGHYFSAEPITVVGQVLLRYKYISVPVFMILAFYYTDYAYISRDINKSLKRILRILIPHVFWALFYTLCYWMVDRAYGYSLHIHKGIKGLIAMLVMGSRVNTAAWYMVDLLIITVVVIVLFNRLSEKTALVVMIVAFLASYALQYSEIWFEFVGRRFTNTIFYWTVGRIPEMVPLASVGILLRYLKVREKVFALPTYVKTCFGIVGLIVIWGFLFRWKYIESLYLENDFMYGGVDKAIIATLSVIVFLGFSMKHVWRTVKHIIERLAKYTLTVYFLHNMVGTLLACLGIFDIIGVKEGTLLGCFLIYVICILFAVLLDRIPVSKAVIT